MFGFNQIIQTIFVSAELIECIYTWVSYRPMNLIKRTVRRPSRPFLPRPSNAYKRAFGANFRHSIGTNTEKILFVNHRYFTRQILYILIDLLINARRL